MKAVNCFIYEFHEIYKIKIDGCIIVYARR